mmetsp:Transcript_62823/g.182257  ORF Transcript_62823/g.182257 Transcript_62823/m.182257 type:complete len:456 (-) Transcript_62823:213-1580(-)
MTDSPGGDATAEAPAAAAESKAAEAMAAKAAGNEALKSADLPQALEHYKKAISLCDAAMQDAEQPKLLNNNDYVLYADGKFAMIDTAYPQFEDYVLMDLGTRDLVKHKVGRHDFDVVSKRFLRKEIHAVPRDLFDLRLACLQNIALATLKLARGTKRPSDYEEAVSRADDALAMDGRSAKALMRKGQALVELKDWRQASAVLMAAAQETKGKDPEVQRLLEMVLIAKGKGRGKGKRAPAGFQNPCKVCGDPLCADVECNGKRPPPVQEESGSELNEEDEEVFRRMAASQDWQGMHTGHSDDEAGSENQEPADPAATSSNAPASATLAAAPAGGSQSSGSTEIPDPTRGGRGEDNVPDGATGKGRGAAPHVAALSPEAEVPTTTATSAISGAAAAKGARKSPPTSSRRGVPDPPTKSPSLRQMTMIIGGLLGALCLVAAFVLHQQSEDDQIVEHEL